MADSVFTDDFSPQPYWWSGIQPFDCGGAVPPDKADVAVIGAGYTGLHAALETARAGLSTVVFDAEAAGFGCSTRNGGQVSTCIKPGFAELSRRYGDAAARAILREGQASLDHLQHFIRDEGIDCDLRPVGRFHAAHSARAYDRLAVDIAAGNPVLETDAYVVPRADQRSELGTDAYCGGAVFPRHVSIDPARYHAGLLHVARRAGAEIVTRCPVQAMQQSGGAHLLTTPRGATRAQKVIVATNGYTTGLTPWLARRVIPIGSYIIATEELPADLMAELMPNDRIVSDTRRVVYYYRASPDRRRILFGGRVSLGETDPCRSGPRLHAEMVRLFPQLARTRISHSWSGTVAYTFDELMHCGERDGVHYALGYCGSGVGMAGYLGMRMGRQAAGLERDASALEDVDFPTRPLYSGNPWFLAPSVGVYRILDRLGI